MDRRLVSLVASLVVAAVTLVGCAGGNAPATSAPPANPASSPAAPVQASQNSAPVPTVAAPAAATQPPAAAMVNYPQKGKTITVLVPYTAGGATDLVARLAAAQMEKDLGTSVAVVNKTGAGGQEAITELVRAKPDGYTISILALPTTLANYLDPQRKADFGRKDFQMLGRFVAAPLNVAVLADGPYKSLKDLVDAAKAKPGRIPMAAGTLFSSYHLGALQFEKGTDTSFAIVTFDGGAQGVTALLGGHVDVTVNQAGELLPQVQAGKIRLLGVLDNQVGKFFPNVPTLESQGYKVYMSTNNAEAGPAGMPKEIVDTLSGEIKKITTSDEFNKKAAELGLEVRYQDPDQLGALWSDLESQVGPLIQQVRSKN